MERATGIKLGKVIIETEKQLLGIDTEHRGVRLDLCICELDNEQVAKVYDIEPNNYDLNALPKRDRYNQALSDVKLLKSKADFNDLPEYVSIWILPDDPFDDGQVIYTVKNMVVENRKIVYNDGVMRLFLNVKGKKGGTEALKKLLNYFSDSCKANATDSELEKLHNIVTDVKLSREVGERYMSLQDYLDYEIKTGIKAGIEEELERRLDEVQDEVRDEERNKSISILIKNSINLGATKENVVSILMKDYSLTEKEANERVLKEWHNN